MNELIQIQRQYERIPEFECIPGCTDCCGPVPFSEAEWKLLPQPPPPLTEPVCQFKGDQGCTIYDKRPLLCRLFGAVDDVRLRCPHGARPVKSLTEQQGKIIMRKYLKNNRMAQDPVKTIEVWGKSLLKE